jgi:hypothetical protein
MLKESVVAYCKILVQRVRKGTEGYHAKPHSENKKLLSLQSANNQTLVMHSIANYFTQWGLPLREVVKETVGSCLYLTNEVQVQLYHRDTASLTKLPAESIKSSEEVWVLEWLKLGLFNGALQPQGFTMPSDRMIVNYELERMWKKMAVAYFKILSQHLPGGCEENHKVPHDTWCPGRDSKRDFPKRSKSVDHCIAFRVELLSTFIFYSYIK